MLAPSAMGPAIIWPLLLLLGSQPFVDGSSKTIIELDDGMQQSEAASLALLAPSSGGGGEKPRLISLVASDSGYSENSSVNILCTVSEGHHETLTFNWFKDGQSLSSSSGGDPMASTQIESQPDHSLLRISRVKSQHAGRYTCSARNQFGQDSSSVNLSVNVKLQWTKEPPREVVVSLNQELKVDCLAQGEPRPQMRWEKLDSPVMSHQQQPHPSSPSRLRPPFGLAADSSSSSASSRNQLAAASSKQSVLVSSNRYLVIQRAKEADSGVYECIASNSHDAELKKLVSVQVRGPPKILPIATADSYPEGSSINLICTVSGGQRTGLSLRWMMNGEELDGAKLSKYSDPMENISIGNDDADISILKIKNATHENSGQYTCTAKNPLGQDSTSVNIVINVELKWTKLPHDTEVGLNQELSLECDALGSPQPTIEWFKHSSDKNSAGNSLVSKGRALKISRAQHKDSGLYECHARNGVDEALRKIIQVKVRGKYDHDSSESSSRSTVGKCVGQARQC